jgi:AcrR family transcriptional regulator
MAQTATSAHAAEGPSEGVVDGILAEEMGAEIGEKLIESLRRLRAIEEAAYRAEHPEEGLRERKRRLQRQTISDAATVMFACRGFDAVRVSEIADRVNVSMKTLYNYFPTKESLVLDDADDLIERLTDALRVAPVAVSVTEAVVAALETSTVTLDPSDDEFAAFALRFARLVDDTPSLRAHWLGILDRLARAAAEQIALRVGQRSTDPLPTIAGRALAGLVQVDNESRIRHITAGLRGAVLREAIIGDVRNAAQLLETGLSSLSRTAPAGTEKRATAKA